MQNEIWERWQFSKCMELLLCSQYFFSFLDNGTSQKQEYGSSVRNSADIFQSLTIVFRCTILNSKGRRKLLPPNYRKTNTELSNNCYLAERWGFFYKAGHYKALFYKAVDHYYKCRSSSTMLVVDYLWTTKRGQPFPIKS